EYSQFLGVFVAEKETDFLRDVLRIFKVGTDVRTNKQLLFLIGGGRATKNERLLRFASVPARPSFLLEVDWDGMCPKIKIKPIRHRDCHGSVTVLFNFCDDASCKFSTSPSGVMQATSGLFYGTTSGVGPGHGNVFT